MTRVKRIPKDLDSLFEEGQDTMEFRVAYAYDIAQMPRQPDLWAVYRQVGDSREAELFATAAILAGGLEGVEIGVNDLVQYRKAGDGQQFGTLSLIGE